MQPPLRFAPTSCSGKSVCVEVLSDIHTWQKGTTLAHLQLICSPKRWNLLFHKIWRVTVLFFSAEHKFFTNLKMHTRFGAKLLNQRRSYLVFCGIVQMFLYLQSCLLSIQVVFNICFQISWQNSGNKMISLDLFLVLFSPTVKMGFHKIPWDVDFCAKSPRKTAHRKLHRFGKDKKSLLFWWFSLPFFPKKQGKEGQGNIGIRSTWNCGMACESWPRSLNASDWRLAILHI